MLHTLRNGLLVATLLAGLSLVGTAWADAPAGPPKLALILSPHAVGGPQSYMGVRMTLEAPRLATDAVLVRLPLKIVGIPGSHLEGDGPQARDDAGPLALTAEDEMVTPQGQYRRWKVSRPTVGDVVIAYHATPRLISAATNNGPLFDLREESGGFAGAGVTFLAVPPGETPYRVSLKWDLAETPAGSRGVGSLGEGDIDVIVPAEALAFSFYAAGPLKSLPGKKGDGFGLYWLSEPPFAADVLGARIKTLHDYMANFFGDKNGVYRVFMRQNPYAGLGGTALPQSFMFGYRSADKPTLDKMQGLLAHEMTHNWPRMEGEHGDTAWYSEGTAEYYSQLLSYRAGVTSLDAFVSALNDKANAYYTNPYVRLGNPEAAKIFWSDPIAQTVPYGRGFLYLLDTDTAIRAKSGGKRSLDDVVLEIRRRDKAGQSYGVNDWLDLVGREIGVDAAKAAYQAMTAGQVITPAARFAPCLTVTPRPTRAFELGFARASLNDDRIVRGLVKGSAAEQAGVREGDQIVTDSGVLEARNDDARSIQLTVKRDGVEHVVTYLPRGAPIQGFVWSKAPTASPETCRF